MSEERDERDEPCETGEGETTVNVYTAGGARASHGFVGGSTPWASPVGWTSTGGMVGYDPTETEEPIPAIDDVELPKKITKKVMIAFLDPEIEDTSEAVIWAKVLELDNVDFNINPEPEEESYMNVNLKMRDVFDNDSVKEVPDDEEQS